MRECVTIMDRNDELQIYGGNDYVINNKIRIRQPTLGEIRDFGEQKYFSFITSFTATPTDMKYQLSRMGKDWNTTSDYELFLMMYKLFDVEAALLVFGNIDFTKFSLCVSSNGELIIYDSNSDIIIDKSVYEIAAGYIRKVHNLSYNVERAMNETTKAVLLEEAEEIFNLNKDRKYKSNLLPLISAVTNMEGFKYSWSTVWDMKINAFMDSVQQLLHIKNVDLLLRSGYSGFGVDLKKIGKKQLNYFSRPNES